LTFAFGSIFGLASNGLPSPFGYALILLFAYVLLFLGTFGFEYFLLQWRLDWNPWVKDVKEMDFLFNPMYWTWLFFHDHKKWARWNTIISTPSVVFLVSLLGIAFGFFTRSPPASAEAFLVGWAISLVLMTLFAFTWYLYYASVDRTPSAFPRGRLSDLPSRL
jgi:hypothetical protein